MPTPLSEMAKPTVAPPATQVRTRTVRPCSVQRSKIANSQSAYGVGEPETDELWFFDAKKAGVGALFDMGDAYYDTTVVLGIETSCDETGIGIVRGRTLLSNTIASSMDEHARFGGVVPEVASRAHLEAMVPTIQRALKDAGVSAKDLDGIAVTAGPGLAGALLVGVSAAKAYAYALGKPLYGVNHLASHICVDQLEHGALPEPTMALLVSGGHSSLLLSTDITSDVRPLGATIDDAAGEAFDKIARVLNLGFPGGPVIDRYAREGDPDAIAFPRGLTGPRDPAYDFSFSGLKTSVARWIEAKRAAGEEVPVRDVAASFQEAVVDVLTRKAVRACKDEGVDHLMIGGGVAANTRLRAMAQERCERAGIRLRVPRPKLCTDNGAMVAALGAEMVARNRAASDLGLSADSSLPVTEPHVPGAHAHSHDHDHVHEVSKDNLYS